MIVSTDSLAILWEALWKSTLVLTLALSLNLLLRKRSADVRRLVISVAIVSVLAGAIALPLLPRWTAEVPAWFDAPLPPAPVAVQAGSDGVISSLPIGVSESAPAPVRKFPDLIRWIWALGATVLLLRFVFSLRGLHRLRRLSQPLEMRSSIQLRQSDNIAAPVTWGIIHPVILVPAGFEALPEESRLSILRHETAHIDAHDFALRVVAEIARALFWFQPLIWIARRQLRIEQELAADNRVLAAGSRPSGYAKLLLDWASPAPARNAAIAIGMAQQSCLKRRIYAVLDSSARREALPAKALPVAAVVALGIVLPLAAFNVSRPGPSITLTVPATVAQAIFLPVNEPPEPIRIAQVRPAPAGIPAPAPQPQITPAPRPMPTFVTSTNLIIVDVTVTGKDGRTKEGLGAADFTLTEDRKPERIILCEFQNLQGAAGVSSYYVLAYYTTNTKADGAFRRIQLALNNPDMEKLDYRAGYYAPTSAPAPIAVDGTNFVTTADTITPPAVMYKFDPEYTDEARKARFSGAVGLLITVGETGSVTDIRISQGLGFGLDQKAMEAVLKWRFRPGSINGKPAATQAQVYVTFRIL